MGRLANNVPNWVLRSRIVKTKLLVLMLLATGAVFAQLSIGVRIGPPPRARVVRVQPRSPGAGYSWVGGYWYPVGHRYTWHEGYWTRAGGGRRGRTGKKNARNPTPQQTP